jgi:hypothetical protein
MNIEYNNTLYFIDWDNTLFPTKWVIDNEILISDIKKYLEYFTILDTAIYTLLSIVMKNGKVMIVTNATESWINDSKIVYPKTSLLLNKIKVISARNLYKNKTNIMMNWKKMAFTDIIKKEYNKLHTINIISIGDALYEQHALAHLNNTYSTKTRYLKTIKFIDNPNKSQLIKQIQILINNIHRINNQKTHLHKVFKLKN